MKPDISSACEPTRPFIEDHLIGADAAGDRSYWIHSEELLFAVRPSRGGRFVYEAINQAFEALLGMSRREIRELDVFDCLAREDAEAVCEILQACLAEGAEAKIHHSLLLGGLRRDVETTVVPILHPMAGNVARLIGGHRLLRKEGLDDTTEEIAYLHGDVSLMSIREDIHQRIASELHDSTCQELVAASLGLMRIRTCLDNPRDVERLCDGIDASIDAALREIRSLTYLLHPQDLTAQGLKATIEQYALGFGARTSLRVSARILATVDQLPYASQRSVLRVIQEALTNIFRHAKATEVKIVIEAIEGHFRLTISDNGRGFPVNQAKRGNGAISLGVGIPAMRARLKQLGGTFEIRSDPAAPYSGTTLCAEFPHGLVIKRRNRRAPLQS
ncbi:PAS domain-containing protein [Bradyrhizobium commune]|uniref:PAS domain-containing protein n=1 Tax=Bradyrhizobium commune TaxID=83627 RepID=A0A7S9H3J6_9BRAD|nr:PAS domain-containing protein [Bradyrhizobium commune]